jgi:hypothetical protein
MGKAHLGRDAPANGILTENETTIQATAMPVGEQTG